MRAKDVGVTVRASPAVPAHSPWDERAPGGRCWRYRALDYSFRLEVDDDLVYEMLDGYLAPFRSTDDRASSTLRVRRAHGGLFSLEVDGKAVPPVLSASDVTRSIVWAVQQDAIRRTSSLLLLHASVAALGASAVALPAPMDSGKTTLVAGLVRSGFSYVSDEVLAIDPLTGLVRPFQKALRLEPPSWPLFPGLLQSLPAEMRTAEEDTPYHYVSAEALRPGAIEGQTPVSLRWVVFPSYVAGSTTRMEPISRAEALVALVDNSYNFKRFKAEGVRVLAQVLRDADCYRLRIGDLPSAIDAVRATVEGTTSSPSANGDATAH